MHTHTNAHSYSKMSSEGPPRSWQNNAEATEDEIIVGIHSRNGNAFYSRISLGHVTLLTWNVRCPSAQSPPLH